MANPLMRAGAPSINPLGRPSKGSTFAEFTRRQVDWSAVLDLLVETVADSDLPRGVRLDAAKQLLDRGWGKPTATVEMSVNAAANALPLGFDQLDPESKREVLSELRARALLAAGKTE